MQPILGAETTFDAHFQKIPQINYRQSNRFRLYLKLNKFYGYSSPKSDKMLFFFSDFLLLWL